MGGCGDNTYRQYGKSLPTGTVSVVFVEKATFPIPLIMLKKSTSEQQTTRAEKENALKTLFMTLHKTNVFVKVVTPRMPMASA